MKVRVEFLNNLRGIIADHRRHIRKSEEAMRQGFGPFDIEATRVTLAELCEVEWLAIEAERKGDDDAAWEPVKEKIKGMIESCRREDED